MLVGIMGVSILLQIFLPSPYGLAIALGLFVLYPLILRRRYMNRMRGYGGAESRRGFFGMGQKMDGSNVKYVCLVCNHRYSGGSCPRCGSKMKRADF